MKLSHRIPLVVTASVLLVAAVTAGVSIFRTTAALEESIYDRLSGVRAAKKSTLALYSRVIEERIVTITTSTATREALLEFALASKLIGDDQVERRRVLKALYERDADDAEKGGLTDRQWASSRDYRSIHDIYHPWFSALSGSFSVEDVILVDRDGTVLYGARKNALFATNLLTGRWKDGPAGRLFRAIHDSHEKDRIVYADFARSPAFGNTMQGFAAFSIFIGERRPSDDGQFAGVAVVRLSQDMLNDIMLPARGMGRTGKAYLVGPDFVSRTSGYGVEGGADAFPVDTPAAREALNGKQGVAEILDYRGVPVLSAYAPVEFFGKTWALLTELDRDEVFAPVDATVRELLIAVALVLAAAAVIAVAVGRSIANPIVRISENLGVITKARDEGMGASALPSLLSGPRDAPEIRRISGAVRSFLAAIERGEEKLNAANAAMSRDLEAAAELQKQLLPKHALPAGSILFDHYYRPSMFVGGDTLHYFQLSDHYAAFYVADVAGHGVPSSLMSVSLTTTLTPEFCTEPALCAGDLPIPDAAAVVTELNHRFMDLSDTLGQFTMIYGVVDVVTGDGAFCQAGHPYPVLLRADGAVEQLGRGGFPVGLDDEPDYENIPFTLRPGDSLLIYSDGISESTGPSGEAFGRDRMTRAALGTSAAPLPAIAQAVDDWRGGEPCTDDLSMVILTMRAAEPRALDVGAAPSR